jgi:hypothetical protein
VRAAVIGGGVFGCAAAVELARHGIEVDLFERHGDILLGATRANQGRLHHGYHYPRAGVDMRRQARTFAARFPDAIRRDVRHYYAVAAEGSKVTGAEYLDFCRKAGLPFARHTPSVVIPPAVQECVRVPESYVDVRALRAILSVQLRRAGVKRHLHTAVTPDDLNHDWVVRATYNAGRPLRFEVCETALIRLGRHLERLSFVVMDGPFMSLDPHGDGHMLYDVTHSVHHANVGNVPEIPDHLAPLIDRGVVHTPHTRVEAMLQTARRFLRGMGMPEYLGSMFTVRAVLPNVDDTDERPTLVERDGRVITVLSGKICAAVWAAEQVTAAVRQAVPA